jgi:hypothetical protein
MRSFAIDRFGSRSDRRRGRFNRKSLTGQNPSFKTGTRAPRADILWSRQLAPPHIRVGRGGRLERGICTEVARMTSQVKPQIKYTLNCHVLVTQRD